MRLVLLLTTVIVHLAVGASSARTPAACRACPTACAGAVSACVPVLAASCPTAPRGKAKRCRRKAKRHCRKGINGCCVDTCKTTGAPVCCGAPTTTTSTTLPGGGGNPCFTDGGDGTVHDTCTGLQWEKKTGRKGVHVTNGLHDINDVFPWAGTCARNRGLFCQPDAASAATCAAQSDGSDGTSSPVGCAECPGGVYDAATNPTGTGPCGDPGLRTIWVWLNQLN